MFERIKPKTPKPTRVRCSATRPPVKWKGAENEPQQCSLFAAVVIDGQPLCMAHAGPVAVDKLAAIQEAAEKIGAPTGDFIETWLPGFRAVIDGARNEKG